MTNEPPRPPVAAEGAAPDRDRALTSSVSASLSTASSGPPSGPDPADTVLRMAADTASRCIAAFDTDMTPASMRAALERALFTDPDGQGTMMVQAQVLDALFHRLAQRALRPDNLEFDRPGYLSERNIELALRSQQLCRATFDSLRRTKCTNEKKDSGKDV